MNNIDKVNKERLILQESFNKLIKIIGEIPIASKKAMPFGWRKAAKGRTVWRIIEEVISQNLELHSSELGFESVMPADSEVGVFDFKFLISSNEEAFVNIKSSVLGGKRNKDDISKSDGLIDFFNSNPDSNLYVATFVIDFTEDMTVQIVDAIVMPITWIPDVYINPSNNGNLQSADYKYVDRAIKRTNKEFMEVFLEEYAVAQSKKRKKQVVTK